MTTGVPGAATPPIGAPSLIFSESQAVFGWVPGVAVQLAVTIVRCKTAEQFSAAAVPQHAAWELSPIS